MHSKRCEFVVMNKEGEELARRDCATTPESIRSRAKEQKLLAREVEAKVGMESCQIATFVYGQLLCVGLSNVVVAPPTHMRST